MRSDQGRVRLPGGWRDPKGRVAVCGPPRSLLALSMSILAAEKHHATSDDDDQAGDDCNGWVAGVGGEDNLRSPDKDEGTSHGRPRRKVTVHHRCSTIACCQGSHVLVRLAGSQALPAELRGARPMTSATSTASRVNGPTSQSRRADGAKSPDVARIVGSRVATAAPYRRFSQTLPQLRIPDRAVS